jgi:hypothetical protein
MRKQEAGLFTPAEAAVLSRLSLKAVNNAIDKKTVAARRTRAGRLQDEPAVVYLSLERRPGGDTTPEFRRRLFAEIAAAPCAAASARAASRWDYRLAKTERV